MLDTIKNSINTIQDSIKPRLANPFFISYLIAFVVANRDYFIILFTSTQTSKTLIKELPTELLFLYPLSWAVIMTIILLTFPFATIEVAYWIDKYQNYVTGKNTEIQRNTLIKSCDIDLIIECIESLSARPGSLKMVDYAKIENASRSLPPNENGLVYRALVEHSSQDINDLPENKVKESKQLVSVIFRIPKSTVSLLYASHNANFSSDDRRRLKLPENGHIDVVDVADNLSETLDDIICRRNR